MNVAFGPSRAADVRPQAHASGKRRQTVRVQLVGLVAIAVLPLLIFSIWVIWRALLLGASFEAAGDALRRYALEIAGLGSLLLLLELCGAYLIARRLASVTAELETAALGLAQGGDGLPMAESTGIAESERVRDSLTQAAYLLHAGKQERDHALVTQQDLADTLALAPVIVRDHNGTIRFWGGGAADLYGFAEHEAVGRCSHDLLQTEFPEALSVIEDTLLRLGYWRGELRHRRKDGRRIVLASRWTLSRKEDGSPRSVIEVNSDITELLAVQEDRFRLAAIVESSEEAIIGEDLNRVVTSWNRGAERMFGYTAAEIVGRKIDILAAPGQEHDPAYVLERTQSGEQLLQHETRRRRKDQSVIDVALTVSPIYDADHCIVGASKIVRDITDRKRSEAALRDSEARFRALLENSPRMMWVSRADGFVEYCNAAWRAYTGNNQTPPGLTWTTVLHPRERLVAEQQRAQAIETGKPYTYDLRLRRNDGTYRWHVVSVAPLWQDGSIIAWVGTGTDVHDMRMMTEVLEQRVTERTMRLTEANAELEAFAYSVAHDLRAPLRSMQGFSRALIEDFGSDLRPEATQYAVRIARGAAHMDQLINDLLAYSRLAREDLRLERLPLQPIINDALRDMQAAIDECRAEIRVEGPLPSVLGHRAVLIQVLTNLIGNALKFVASDTVPRVTIRSEESAEAHRIWVEDNGIGIAEQHREKIFQVFQRLHSQSAYPGTGIGLAIVRKGIERMGGEIGVDSAPGFGSRFWFELKKEA